MKALIGKNAVVTGSSRGIGTYIAAALVKEGVNLALVARSATELEAVARRLSQSGPRVIAIPGDVTRDGDRRRLVERAERELGQIDILVNNAGIGHWIAFERQDEHDITAVIATNLLAPVFLTRLVLPAMIRRGSGHIVNVSSMSAKLAVPYEAVYSASKAGLVSWSNALRMELEDSGVGVSALCPAYVAEVGGFSRSGFFPSRVVGLVSPKRVAHAVVKAIQSNAQEVLIWRWPARPLLALNAMSPKLGNQMLRSFGVIKLNRKLAGVDRDLTRADSTASGSKT